MRKNKILSFISVLSKLDKQLSIRQDLAVALDDKLKNESLEQKEKTLLMIIESLDNKDDKEFLEAILCIDNLNIEDLLRAIINRIANNSNELKKISRWHNKLIKLVLTTDINKLDKESLSTSCISKYHLLIKNSLQSNNFRNYLNNPSNPSFKNNVEPILLKDGKELIRTLFLCCIFSFLEDENTVNSLKNRLKEIIGYYAVASQKIVETQELLIPLSIIAILGKIYNESVNLYNFGNVSIGQIFNYINKAQEDSFYPYLQDLVDFDGLCEFLFCLKKIQINKAYKEKIANTILKKDLYTPEILVNFCEFFLNNSSDRYREVIEAKNKESQSWYEKDIIYNLTNDKAITDTFLFLNTLNRNFWFRNPKITEELKNFFKTHPSDVIESESIFETFRMFLDEKQKLNFPYSEFGKTLKDYFKNLSDIEERKLEHLKLIFANITLVLKKEAFIFFLENILEFIKDNVSNIRENHFILFKILPIQNNIFDRETIRKLFGKLIDNPENQYAWQIFKLIIEETDALNEEYEHMNEELKSLKNLANEEAKKVIENISDIIKEKSHAT